MATPEDNENCYHVLNDLHRCKIKLGKFHFDFLRCYGVIKESFPGGGILPPLPPGEVGLSTLKLPCLTSNFFLVVKRSC